MCCAVGISAIVGLGCSEEPDGAAADPTPAPIVPLPPNSPPSLFDEIASKCGLDFVHQTGAGGDYYFPEIAGSGCAVFDYDGDGDLDVYALQAFPLGEVTAQSVGGRGLPHPALGGNRLFRNDLTIDGAGVPTMRFVDVSDEAGVRDRGYAMGVAVGDIDNDGDLDLYVTNFGPNTLYINNGDGAFTAAAPDIVPAEDRWSTSAAFVDFDLDGWLDLFVCNYVNFSLLENKICHSASGRREYCGPASFEPLPDRLFRNRGDGSFEDVSIAGGLARAFGSGLGVVTDDFNHDGWPDLYVANDGNGNQLWLNNGDGTFTDSALLFGAAYNVDGEAEAGMGVTSGDFDCDGDMDIFLSHLRAETNTLLVNDGTAIFDDASQAAGLGAVSRNMTGFGAQFVDLNNNGLLDLVVANGAVTMEELSLGEVFPYGVPNQVFMNQGPPQFSFADRSSRAGDVFTALETSRGAAFGDIDNDGDVDVLVSNANGPLRLFQNTIGSDNGWMGIELRADDGDPFAYDAVIELLNEDNDAKIRRVGSDGSYCAANDHRIVFGLGETRGVQSVLVTWPDGARERFDGLASGAYHTLSRGAGSAP